MVHSLTRDIYRGKTITPAHFKCDGGLNHCQPVHTVVLNVVRQHGRQIGSQAVSLDALRPVNQVVTSPWNFCYLDNL